MTSPSELLTCLDCTHEGLFWVSLEDGSHRCIVDPSELDFGLTGVITLPFKCPKWTGSNNWVIVTLVLGVCTAAIAASIYFLWRCRREPRERTRNFFNPVYEATTTGTVPLVRYSGVEQIAMMPIIREDDEHEL